MSEIIRAHPLPPAVVVPVVIVLALLGLVSWWALHRRPDDWEAPD